ncbi:MAG: MotA/TolQ/ExbB proton channel family protein [Myxococcota bacterium]
MQIEERLNALASLGAGWVMWLLVALSVVAVAIVIERLAYFFRTRDDRTIRERALPLIRKGKFDELRAIADEGRGFPARVLSAGLTAPEEGPAAAEQRMEGAASTTAQYMSRNVAFLGTVGSNAPFIGLLGTVIGVINAFAALEGAAGQVTDGLMAEVGEALVATAVGILVALPAVAFYNLFSRVVRARRNRAQALGNELVASLYARQSASPLSFAESAAVPAE